MGLTAGTLFAPGIMWPCDEVGTVMGFAALNPSSAGGDHLGLAGREGAMACPTPKATDVQFNPSWRPGPDRRRPFRRSALMPIVSDPKVMMGDPTRYGARIQMEPILERFAAGGPRSKSERATRDWRSGLFARPWASRP